MDFSSRLLLLVVINTAVSGASVRYISVSCVHESVCALLESNATLTCSHSGVGVRSSFWFVTKHKARWRSDDDPEDLALEPEYAGRVSYAVMSNFSTNLLITDLRESDAGEYRLALITDDGQKIVSSTGVALELTGLQVSQDSMNGDVHCRTSCSLNPNRIFWYENGQYMKDHNENHLSLNKLKRVAYRCSVIGFNQIRSPQVCYTVDCWDVIYTNRRVCALLGSSVEFSGSYTYPTHHTIKNVFWVSDHQNPSNNYPEDLKKKPQFYNRVEYVQDSDRSSLKLKRLIMRDSGEYRLRIITDNNKEAFSGRPGVILNVTDVQVRSSVESGDAVTLACSTSCTLPGNPTYIWYKNNQPVPRPSTKYNKLYLSCSTDAGNYSCAVVVGRDDLRSPAQTVRPCDRNPASDSSRTHVSAVVGVAVVLALILIAGALCIRMRRSRSAEKHSEAEIKEQHTGQDEVHYSSIHFLPSGTHGAPSRSASSPRDEDVQYAVVNFKNAASNRVV